jgi:hypothetical protein
MVPVQLDNYSTLSILLYNAQLCHQTILTSCYNYGKELCKGHSDVQERQSIQAVVPVCLKKVLKLGTSSVKLKGQVSQEM